MVFEDFETPLDLPRTICFNAEGQEMTAPVEPKNPPAANADAYGCQICFKPYNSWNGLKYHLKNKHADVHEDDYVFKRMAAYEGLVPFLKTGDASAVEKKPAVAASSSSATSSASFSSAEIASKSASAAPVADAVHDKSGIHFTYRRPYVV